MNTQIIPSDRFVLGMNLDELSLHDITEELSDISRDIYAITDYEQSIIGYSELKKECSFEPADKLKLIEAKAKLQQEVTKRNSNP